MNQIFLSQLIKHIRAYSGIKRKRIIPELVPFFFSKPERRKITVSFGEDAAVIELPDSVLLFAADGIMESVIKKNPRWAGYCSMLVNINDIAAMGGSPLAAVNVLSVRTKAVMTQILHGMRAASIKFDVPIVGGHVHPNATHNEISVAIIGTASSKKDLLYSHTANIGDNIVFASDLNGRFTPGLPFSWDTTSFKSPESVRIMVKMMKRVATQKLATACKDISIPGALGTLAILLEASGHGGRVDIQKIPKPKHVPLLQWLTTYQGFGFVLTACAKNTEKLIAALSSVGIQAAACGMVVRDKKLVLRHGSAEATLFDFRKERIIGKI